MNLKHVDAPEATDQAARLKYATRELARRRRALATFMAKPFTEHAGNSMHLHLSLCHDGELAFATDHDTESPLMRQAVGGILRHLPGIVVFGAPAVNDRGEGNLYTPGEPLPHTLADATRSARDDTGVHDVLGADAVHDFLAVADLEWSQFVGSVSEWDRERYLRSV